MSYKVQLYVYDLSSGMAKQMSLRLTGMQIDGIWHTSIVVFGKEIFYGRGIGITAPGRSHHGQPLQIMDMGETSLDEQTFDEYLEQIRDHYTPEKYHLLDFNCNSFTNDCLGFLVGGSIPSWIKDLPANFLSTPLGIALRPTIDAMFNQGRPEPPNIQGSNNLLQGVASRAAAPITNSYHPGVTDAAQLQICSNPQSLRSILASHKAAIVYFTSQGCPPCRVIKPIFEELAQEKGSAGVTFVLVDLGVGLGSSVAEVYGVRVTPTFIFFLQGEKVSELKGANVPELKTQVDLLIFQAFPPHPHNSLDLPEIRKISLQPILFSQVPNFDAVYTKLSSFVDGLTPDSKSRVQRSSAMNTLKTEVIPFFKKRFVDKTTTTPAAVRVICAEWCKVTAVLVDELQPHRLFPIVDIWRVGLLDAQISDWCTTASTSTADPVHLILQSSIVALEDNYMLPALRNLLLTVLRMVSNALANRPLAQSVLDAKERSTLGQGATVPRRNLTSLLVNAMLHEDATVRASAASVAFSIAVHERKLWQNKVGGVSVQIDDLKGEWYVEVVSAIVEAISREEQSEDVVHRLAASLAYFLLTSPYYENYLSPLLEVLQAKDILRSKLRGGFGGKGLTKSEHRKLLEEVASYLCP